ncbi:MAG: 4Fe-4S binding protein [Acutalibacteraceae bacterium]
MLRKIIKIDEEKCNGCGACAAACHEGAIAMREGKAELMREDYCDGLGDCLPSCPTGAISFEMREAPAYDRDAVKADMMNTTDKPEHHHAGCPGSAVRRMKRNTAEDKAESSADCFAASELENWPVQIKLAPVGAPYFNGAKLLIAADCTAYAYAAFHSRLIKGRVTLIGCPKLDGTDYSEKLTQIIKNNDIKSVCVVRMEVPCCGGIEADVKKALQASGKFIPWQTVTVSVDGEISE